MRLGPDQIRQGWPAISGVRMVGKIEARVPRNFGMGRKGKLKRRQGRREGKSGREIGEG